MTTIGRPPETGFAVITNDGLSVSNLGQLVQQGEAVMRTPHIGNWSLYNGVYAEQGITMVVHDLTVPARDRNYHPGDQIVGSKPKRLITKEDMMRLVTHITATQVAGFPEGTGLPDDVWAQDNEPLVDAHLRSLRRAYPNASITTRTEYLLAREARTTDMMRAIVGADLGDWKRYVDPEGVTHILDGSPSDLVARHGMFADGSARGEKEGMLPPVTATIIALAVHDALDHGTDTVYHISGPDMINYINEPAVRAELQDMYTAVRRSPLGALLPETLQFHILPGTGARLTVPAARRPELDTFLAAHVTMHELNTELRAASAARDEIEQIHKAALRAQDPSATALAHAANARLNQAKKLRNAHDPLVRQAATASTRTFASTDKGRYPSHYDILADPNGQYTHPLALTTPLGELAVLAGELSDLVIRK